MLKQPNAAGSRARPDTISLGEPPCRGSTHWARVFLAIDRSALCKCYDRLLFRKPHFQLSSSPKSNFLIHTSFFLNTSVSSTKQIQSFMSTSNEMPIAPAITATHLDLGVACICAIKKRLSNKEWQRIRSDKREWYEKRRREARFDNKQAEHIEGLAVTADFLFHCKKVGK